MVGTVRQRAVGDGVEWFDPEHETWHAAVYHDDIRDSLIAQASTLGAYRYPHGVGTLPNDITAYKHEQRDWGADRAHWPAILYQYEPTVPAPRTPRADHWKTEAGEFILDIVNDPLLDYAKLPPTISSCEKPAFLEAWFRSNSRIVMKDIRGRMPQDPKGNWDGGLDPIRSGTLGMRMTRFRETHGMISWRRKKGSEQIKAYMDSILPQACKDANSIRGFRVLHPHEKYALHLGNIGQMPERSHAGTKDLSDERKAAVNKIARAKYESLKAAFEAKQAAGNGTVDPDTSSSSESDLEDISEPEHDEDSNAEDALQNLDLSGEYEDDDWLSSLVPARQADVNERDEESRATGLDSTGTSRDEEKPAGAAHGSDTDDEDGFLSLRAEHQVHQVLLFQLLVPSRLQFATITGRQPAPTTATGSYNEQWEELQVELEEHWDASGLQDQVPELIGLARLTRSEIRWNNPAETRTFPRDTMILIAQLLVDFD
ncbi:hypothetical protein MMC26_002290 [Xylographa opegraphella]|nr:hypothetical protein [Xylographa opegraphella]